jgi:hypothetical protein
LIFLFSGAIDSDMVFVFYRYLFCWGAARGETHARERGALNAGQAWIFGVNS